MDIPDSFAKSMVADMKATIKIMDKESLLQYWKEFVMRNKGNACNSPAFQALNRIGSARMNAEGKDISFLKQAILSVQFDLKLILPKDKHPNYTMEMDSYEMLIHACT